MASVLVNKKMLRDERLLLLMEASGRGRAELAGILALFWLASREDGVEALPLAAAAGYIPLAGPDASTMSVHLLQAGYLALEQASGLYQIVDNAGAAERLKELQARTRKAGAASAAKRAAKKRPKKVKPEAQIAAASPSVNAQAWQAYSAAYKDRYGHEPVRNAKTNGIVALFTKRIPQLEAPAVLAFYVHHNDMRYVHKLHPLDFALKDAEALYTQFKSGHVVTYAEAKAAERVANPLLPSERTLEVRGQLEAIRRGDI